MPIIPLKQKVQIQRASAVSDGWGNFQQEPVIEMRCRVDVNTELITNPLNPNVVERVVAEHKIMFDKLADIDYEDTIIYTNELNHTIKQKPKNIKVLRDISGKPMFTVVYI